MKFAMGEVYARRVNSAGERRKPERRRRLVVVLSRRLALVALGAAVALVALPRLLTEVGLAGPSLDEQIAAAERTRQAAESYGAGPRTPGYDDAVRRLAEARALQRQGKGRDARRAAARATEAGIAAQREALVAAQDERRRAEGVVRDLDARVNALEDRFTEVTPRLAPPEVSRLLTAMKSARQAAGAVFLAWEQQQPRQVLAREAEARRALDATAEALAAARP
jgi:hypothetical protein